MRMDETAGGDCVRSVAAATVIYWHQLKCQNLPNIGPDLISGESRETEKQGGGVGGESKRVRDEEREIESGKQTVRDNGRQRLEDIRDKTGRRLGR